MLLSMGGRRLTDPRPVTDSVRGYYGRAALYPLAVQRLYTEAKMDRRPTSFNPNSYPDVPLYNIQAVAASTGVPSITLRSWERRYGVPEPKRDPKGYRLYSERDIAVTRWLKERVEHGVGISRAVNMLRVLEQEEPEPVEQQTLDLHDLRQRLMLA